MVAVARRRRTVFTSRFINKASAVGGGGGGGGGGVLAWLPPMEFVATSENSRGNSYQTGFLFALCENLRHALLVGGSGSKIATGG